MTISKFKISNKVLSMLLCLAMLLSYLPLSSLTAFAAEGVIEVDTADELVSALQSGGSIKLIGNIEIGSDTFPELKNGETTLDLNGYAITSSATFCVNISDATLTVTGEGSIKASNANLFVVDGYTSKLIVESGCFEATYYTISVFSGEAVLRGGTFKARVGEDVIHKVSGNNAIVTITGGSYSSDPWDYTADGYVSTLDSETGYYTVAASDLSQSYNISIGATENGTVTADVTAVPAGKIVRLKVKPTETFMLDTLTVMQGDTPVTVTDRSFKMPAGDVTVTATFKAIDTTTITGLYITVNGIKYESSTAETPVVINSDSDVTVTLYGYKFDTLPSYGIGMKNAFVYFGSNSSYLFSGAANWTFDTTSTPNTATGKLDRQTITTIIKEQATTAKELLYTNDGNATEEGSGIYVIYKANNYNVNIAETTGGTVTADVAYAEPNNVVTLTVTPDAGNVLYRLTATDANGNTVPVYGDAVPVADESGDATFPVFEMPASDVTVTAEFVAANALPDTVYFDNSYASWDAVAAFSDPYGNSVGLASLQLVAGGIYSATVPSGATGIVFGDLSANKATAIQWLPTDGSDLFTPGSETDGFYTGSWSTYVEGTPTLPNPLYIKTDLTDPLISFSNAKNEGVGDPLYVRLTAVSDGIWSFTGSVPAGAVSFTVSQSTQGYTAKIPTSGDVNLYDTTVGRWYIYVPTYTITAEASPTDGGAVSGGGNYTQSTSVTLTATPADGYKFINWTENGVEVSTNASYTFTATGNRTLVANFETIHTHQWTYTVNDANDTITATCTATGCSSKNGGYVTISAPGSLTYTGSKIGAVVDDKLTTGDTVTVTYTGDITDGYPVNAGEYIASITLGGEATIRVEYTIEKATPTADDFVYTAPTDLTYNGNDKEATVAVKNGIVGMGKLNVKYYRYASGMWIDNERAPRSPGRYKVGIWLEEGDNYKGVNSSERIWLGDEFEIKYLETSAEATVSGTKGSNGWYTSAVTLNAPGYTISKSIYETYGESLTFADEQNKTVTYYLKNNESGEIAEKTVELKIDKTDPEAKYKIGTDGWKQFISTITFGLFCKDYKTVEIDYSDNLSGIAKKQYYIANEEVTDTSSIAWSDYTDALALNATGKYFIYMRVVDNAGHEVILNTEGIVIYEDSVQVTENVSTTYRAGESKDITVNLNGNNVKSVFCGETELTGNDYSADTNGTITLKSAYLDTLNAGEYTITVSYNPQGVVTDKVAMTTTFTMSVKQKSITGANVEVNGTYSYSGSAHTPEPVVTLGGITLIKDSDYTVSYSNNEDAGTATVTVTGKNNYKDSASTTFSISKADLTVTAKNHSIKYGEAPSNNGVTYSGFVANETDAVLSGTLAFDYTYTKGNNVGSYEITPKGLTSNNYEITFAKGTLTVEKADAIHTAPAANVLTYTGAMQALVTAGTVDGGTMEYSLDGTNWSRDIPAATKAGEYTVWYKVVSDSNHNSTAPASINVEIKKATPDLGTVSADGAVYDTTKPEDVVLTQTGTVEGVFSITDAAMLANKAAYNYTFTPRDTENYYSVTGQVAIDVLDTVVPTVSISIDEHRWTFWDTITFGLFYNESKEVTITCADNENGSGIKEIVYFVANRDYEADELRVVEWKSYTEAFDIDPDGKYVVYAKAVDNGGNALTVNSDGLVLDKTQAVVEGLTNGGTYYGQLVFTVADELAGVKSVVIDGNDETHFEGQYAVSGDNAEHTVVVTDNAGNVTEYKVTVYKNYTVIYKVDGVTVDTQTVGHGKDATAPAIPAKDGFVGKWDLDGNNITGDTTVSAVYTEIPAVKPHEVKPDDKIDLEDTKKQLEDMLDDDSYTEDDKKNIQDVIDNIDDALEVIDNVDEVEDLIDKLPNTIKKDDEDAIKAADDAYNALTDYEKSLVDKDAKKALDDAKAALAELNKPADTTSPNTGDNSNLWLWVALLFVSGGCLFGITLNEHKRKAATKR